jgi:hypothetical protein
MLGRRTHIQQQQMLTTRLRILRCGSLGAMVPACWRFTTLPHTLDGASACPKEHLGAQLPKVKTRWRQPHADAVQMLCSALQPRLCWLPSEKAGALILGKRVENYRLPLKLKWFPAGLSCPVGLSWSFLTTGCNFRSSAQGGRWMTSATDIVMSKRRTSG